VRRAMHTKPRSPLSGCRNRSCHSPSCWAVPSSSYGPCRRSLADSGVGPRTGVQRAPPPRWPAAAKLRVDRARVAVGQPEGGRQLAEVWRTQHHDLVRQTGVRPLKPRGGEVLTIGLTGGRGGENGKTSRHEGSQKRTSPGVLTSTSLGRVDSDRQLHPLHLFARARRALSGQRGFSGCSGMRMLVSSKAAARGNGRPSTPRCAGWRKNMDRLSPLRR
jgi:hypothetical protein